MSSLGKYFHWLTEVLVVILVLLVINNYLGNQEVVIKADGKGYYDYLPATFIYNDLNFKYTDTLVTQYYDHHSYSSGYLKMVNGHQVDKYFPGVAVLWVPFFWGAHAYALHSDYLADGYSYPYQKSVFFAAVFYLFLGLFFLRKVLEKFKIQNSVIFGIQLLFALATPLLNYVQYDPSFTHVYSFALVNAMVYFGILFIDYRKVSHAVVFGLLLGVITIVRPVNLMAILLVLLYFSSFNQLMNFKKEVLAKHTKALITSLIVFFLVGSIVPVIWYIQTGKFLIWGYENEGFNFTNPAFLDFLFSARKGALVHTPLLFVALALGLVAFRKSKYQLGVIICVISLVTYVLSSWWSWFYGASFGSRPMIEYYVLFAVLLGAFLSKVGKVKWQLAIFSVLLFLVPINIIHTFQYQNYITDWEEMTFEKFQVIGLHTGKKYRGMYFRRDPNFTDNQQVMNVSHSFDGLAIHPEEQKDILVLPVDSILDLANVNWVKIEADMSYESGNSELILEIKKRNEDVKYHFGYYVFGTLQMENTRGIGSYYYQIPGISLDDKVSVKIVSHDDHIFVHEIQLTYFSTP